MILHHGNPAEWPSEIGRTDDEESARAHLDLNPADGLPRLLDTGFWSPLAGTDLEVLVFPSHDDQEPGTVSIQYRRRAGR